MQEKSPYRQKKILLTALRKKCLPCRENSAYRTKKNLLTGWRKYSLPHDGKFILPCIIRPFCVGRNNWKLIDTVSGANASAIIYSIVETAKANDLNIYKYLKYLLTEIPQHMDETSTDFIEELLPWSKTLPPDCRKKKASN